MGKVISKTICVALSLLLVASCLNLTAVKQLAFAAQEKTESVASSSESNHFTEDANTLEEDSLYTCKNTSNGVMDIHYPFKNPINMMLKGFYAATLRDKYDLVSKKIYKSIYKFIHGKAPDPYKEAKATLDTIDANLKVLQAEMTKVFESYTLTKQMDSIKEQINIVTANLQGTGQGGFISLMNDTLKDYEESGAQVKANPSPENLRTHSNSLGAAANIYDYKKDNINNQLYKDFSSLWGLVCEDSSEGSMRELYKACLKSEPNPEYARNMFDRLYCTFLCNLLTINELMDYANAARIEQLDFVSSDPTHWEAITEKTGGLFEGMTKSYVLSLIHEDKVSVNEGLYIKRGKAIQEERKAILEKMSEIMALEDSTPRIVVSYYDGKKDVNTMFHSIGDAWACAMEHDNVLVSLQSDVLTFRKKGDQDFYGRRLNKDEDITTTLISRKDKKDSKCFKNNNLQVPYKVNVTLELNGHSLGNTNSPEPVLNIEGYSKVTITGGTPVNGGDMSGNVGQIDGIYGGNKVEVNVSNTEFNNVIKVGSYQLEEKKKSNANASASSDASEENTEIRTVEYVEQKFSKPANNSLLRIKVDNTPYGKTSQVKVDRCVFAMDDTTVLGKDVAGAIRMEADIKNKDKAALSVDNSIFENCISRHGNGGAIYTPGKTKVTNSKFTNCVAENGNGGAICSYNQDKTQLDEKCFVQNSTFTNCVANNGNGGAICSCFKTQINVCNFENCKAVKADNKTTQHDGGAIYHDASWYDSFGHTSDAIIKHSLDVNSSNFSSNEAKNGGAVYSIGCMYVNDVNNFTNNTAEDNGGAIFNIRATWEDYEAFVPTTGLEGCVCFNNKVDGSIKFENNKAGKDGGAISTDAYLGMTGTSPIEMKNNKAGNNGGAIHSYKTSYPRKNKTFKYHPKLDFGERSMVFEENSAKNGGAIWSQRDVNSDYMTAEKNKAEENGAIYMSKDATLKLNVVNKITGNSATMSCGGVNGKLSVAGHVEIKDNCLRAEWTEEEPSNAFIPKEGLYFEDALTYDSVLYVNANGGAKGFRLTDDKSDQSQGKSRSGLKWSERLERSSNVVFVDKSNAPASYKKHKESVFSRSVFWLEA